MYTSGYLIILYTQFNKECSDVNDDYNISERKVIFSDVLNCL
jgi:hypothetical protein